MSGILHMIPSQAVAALAAGVLAVTCSPASAAGPSSATVIAIIGTGDMGDSLGPRLAAAGHTVVYGSREPGSEAARRLAEATGSGARVASQREAAAAGDIVILAVPWPAMETVARDLGSLDGKIVIDISFPHRQAEDGYYEPLVATSSAELIQQWNPGARVVKAFALQASYVIDDPEVVGGPVTVPIAADDRAAKEEVGRLVAALGLDPVDAGPLRMARDLEAMQRVYAVPWLQRRQAAWEFYFRRSYFWECVWEDDWSEQVADADRLARLPETQGEAMACPGTRAPSP